MYKVTPWVEQLMYVCGNLYFGIKVAVKLGCMESQRI